jgi:GT2 family glycosyltransferase
MQVPSAPRFVPTEPTPGAQDEPRTAAQRIAELEALLARQWRLLLKTTTELRALRLSENVRLLLFFERHRDRLLPPGSLRRRCYDALARCTNRVARAVLRALARRSRSINAGYGRWIRANEPDRAELDCQRQTNPPTGPLFSVIVSVPDQPAAPPSSTVASILTQTYARWELCLVRPVGAVDHTISTDARIRLLTVSAGASKAEGLHAALAAVRGDFVAVVECGDRLAPSALFELATSACEQPDVDVLYTDEDRQGGRGTRCDPDFKPDWSPDTLLETNYIGALCALRRELVESVGGLRPEFSAAALYDLILRCTARAAVVHHVPRVLYHRRTPRVLDPVQECRALQDHLQRTGTDATVRPGAAPGTYDVARAIGVQPLVSVLIPNRDQPEMLRRCVESLFKSSYPNVEILIAENGSQLPATFALYEELERRGPVQVLNWARPFNYSAINNFAARHAGGEVLVLLNNDTEVINPDWLERMLEHTLVPEVGAVGAKLYYPTGEIQHAGVIVVPPGHPTHAQVVLSPDAPSSARRLHAVHNVSAVTAACLMMRRSVYDEVGGLDEAFPVAFNDTDLCLRLRAKGYRIVWTPHAELRHFESATRGTEDTPDKCARHTGELLLFMVRWHDSLERGDVYHRPLPAGAARAA